MKTKLVERITGATSDEVIKSPKVE